MKTEELNMILTAIQNVSGDAKEVLYYYFAVRATESVVPLVVCAGLALAVMHMMKWYARRDQRAELETNRKSMVYAIGAEPDAEWYRLTALAQNLRLENERLKARIDAPKKSFL